MLRRLTGTGGSETRPRGRRTRLGGCLLWILGLIIVVIILSLMFGGFQKGTKVNGMGLPVPFSVSAVGCPSTSPLGGAGAPA
jgi:hypothetical protein